MGTETSFSQLGNTFESAPGELGEVIVSKEEIAQHVSRIAQEIAKDYSDKLMVIVTILNGSMPFSSALMMALGELGVNAEWESLNVDSYGDGFETSGPPQVSFFSGTDRWQKLRDDGRKIVIVEDIVDSGYTLEAIRGFFAENGIASVAFVALLQKTGMQRVDVEIEHLGQEVPNVYVVGWGLDGAEQYRGLPDIRTLKP